MTQYILLAAFAGSLLPLQALINARLASLLTGPLSATVASFFVGLIGLIGFMALLRVQIPNVSQALATPWWAWLGGLLGAIFIFAATTTVPHLGAAGTFAVVIAAQLIAAILLDHFGILHAAQPVTVARIFGAAFLIAGLYLILRPQS